MDERGFTLVELLVGMTVLVILMMATFNVLDDSTKLAIRDNDRTTAVRDAQVGLDRMIRELRHTSLVNSATPQVLDVNVTRRGVDRRVVFDCSVAVPGATGLRRCMRTPSGGPAELLVDRVRDIGADASAFTYTPASGARHVRVRIGVAVDGGKKGGYGDALVLTDGTALRHVPEPPRRARPARRARHEHERGQGRRGRARGRPRRHLPRAPTVRATSPRSASARRSPSTAPRTSWSASGRSRSRSSSWTPRRPRPRPAMRTTRALPSAAPPTTGTRSRHRTPPSRS